MTDQESRWSRLLAGCRLLPGSWEKRFIRSLAEREPGGAPLSEKQRGWLARLVYRYRRQLGMADEQVRRVQREIERDGGMTEAEWLSSTDPVAMLEYIRQNCKSSDRRLRLFACACCRQVWDLLTDDAPCDKCRGTGNCYPVIEDGSRFGRKGLSNCFVCSGTGRINRSRRAVEVAERYADGEAGERELGAVWREAPHDARLQILWSTTRTSTTTPSSTSLVETGLPGTVQATLLREVMGNPFKLSAIPAASLAWRDGLIVSMANGIYGERRFEQLPILADALEESGCFDVAILEHARSDQHHVRGCWLIDSIIGRE